jgi:LPXTG-site transpeptidase (sortase) family protein
MTHRPYFERIAHVLASVTLGLGLLALPPLLQIFSTDAAGLAPSPVTTRPRAAHVREGDLVARFSVPRLSLDVAVYEGVGTRTLAWGPGHLPGTALPGEEGTRNPSVIAVPRDAGSALVEQMRVGDGVDIRSPFGLKRYRVSELSVVPADRLHFRPTDRCRVAVVTPYPANEVGPAPLRLAVLLDPVADENAASVAAAAVVPHRILPRAPRERSVAPAQLVKAESRSETRSTGRIVRSGYADASAALPDGK